MIDLVFRAGKRYFRNLTLMLCLAALCLASAGCGGSGSGSGSASSAASAESAAAAAAPQPLARQIADDEIPTLPDMPLPGSKPANFTYRDLVGYDEAISLMRDYGVGLQNDRSFINFVGMLNHRHGLDRMPALDTMLFRSPAREDAMRFVEATIGELNLPALRMSMDENIQGMPVLCVSAKSDNHPKLNRAHNRFEGPGILVVEDLDLWIVPPEPENTEGFGGFMMANMSRGAR